MVVVLRIVGSVREMNAVPFFRERLIPFPPAEESKQFCVVTVLCPIRGGISVAFQAAYRNTADKRLRQQFS